jgi:uncharacterized protein
MTEATPEVPWCEECERHFFYPRPRCPFCHGDRVTLASPPAGWTVRSYASVVRPQARSFDARVPITLVVGSAHGVHMICEGHGWDAGPPRIGEEIILTSTDPGEGEVVPVFVPAERKKP